MRINLIHLSQNSGHIRFILKRKRHGIFVNMQTIAPFRRKTSFWGKPVKLPGNLNKRGGVAFL